MSDGLLALLPVLAASLIMLNGNVGEPRPLILAAALAQSIVLVWCRRFPLTVLIVVLGWEIVLAVSDMNTIAGPLAAAFGLGLWGKRPQQRVGVAAVLVTVLIGGAVLGTNRGIPLLVIAPLYIAGALLFIGFWAVGWLGARQRSRVRELRARSQRLEAERELVEQRAADRERSLLARELHDILNHSVTTMVLDAEAAAETGEGNQPTLRRVAATGRESLAELRRLLGVLREPHDHDPLAVPPTLDQLDELADGTRVRLERHGHVRQVDASIELAAYRVVQESLTNVAKHAGVVDVEVSLTYSPGLLDVRIGNSPPAVPVPSLAGTGTGIGLVGMRERVELLGGSLQAGPRKDGGFEVYACLPLRSTS